MIFVIFLMIGFMWFCLFMALSMSEIGERNKWGPDAVENYCNATIDRFESINKMIIGLIGFIFFMFLGAII